MIVTQRLSLRPWRVDDLCDVQAILGDPDVMQFSDQGILSEEDQAAWINRAVSVQPKDELPGCLAIERKHDGTCIGYVSLSRDLTRVGPRDAEIGFRLAKGTWKKGYATEAVRGMIAAVSAIGTTKRIVAIVDPNNQGSVRLLKKLGMTLEGEIMLDGYSYPDHVYVRQLSMGPQNED